MSASATIPEGWEDVRHVLVAGPSSVAALLMAMPAVRAVKSTLPDAHVTFLSQPGTRDVLSICADVDSVMSLDQKWTKAGTEGQSLALPAVLESQRFDAAFLFPDPGCSIFDLAYLLYLAGVRRRLALEREFGGSLLTTWVKPRTSPEHRVEANLALLRAAGFSVVESGARFRASPTVERYTTERLADLGMGADWHLLIYLAPDAVVSQEEIRQVAMLLADRVGRSAVCVFGERMGCLCGGEDGGSRWRTIALQGERTSVEQLAAFIHPDRLVVTDDPLFFCLCDVAGVPVVGVGLASDLALSDGYGPWSESSSLFPLTRGGQAASAPTGGWLKQIDSLELVVESVVHADRA